MLLDQLDDLTARITALTALLDAAIAALPAGSPSTDPATSTNAHDLAEGEGTPRPGPTPTSYASAIARLCAIPGAGPDSVRAVIGEAGSRGALLRPRPPQNRACASSMHTAQASREGVAGAGFLRLRA